MKTYLFFILLLIIASCSKIPVPSILAPSENRNIQKVNFGEEPASYQNILKNYLIMNLKNYKTAKVEFSNLPSKFSIDHLGNNYSGYRVCLSINEKKDEYYTGYKNHFFMIYNNKVNLHLYDSGLLTIPFSYCVSRNINNEYFIDDIPDQAEEISVESMDAVELTSGDTLEYKKLKTELDKLKKQNEELKRLNTTSSESTEKDISPLAKIEKSEELYYDKADVYISCVFDDSIYTYIFNDDDKTFKFINKLDITSYKVNFNSAYIVATYEELELTINRVNGNATLSTTMPSTGNCDLKDKTKF